MSMYISSANALIDRRVNMSMDQREDDSPGHSSCVRSRLNTLLILCLTERARKGLSIRGYYPLSSKVRASKQYLCTHTVGKTTDERVTVSDSIESLPFRNIRLSTGNQQQLVVSRACGPIDYHHNEL